MPGLVALELIVFKTRLRGSAPPKPLGLDVRLKHRPLTEISADAARHNAMIAGSCTASWRLPNRRMRRASDTGRLSPFHAGRADRSQGSRNDGHVHRHKHQSQLLKLFHGR